MEYCIINKQEIMALRGLPHLQQSAYILAIRPYMDWKSGVVGKKRKISYQSLAEDLYIEPHPGIKSGSPSRQQLRRVIKSLERAGLLEIQSSEKNLILKCLLTNSDFLDQNKADTKPTQKANTVNSNKPLENKEDSLVLMNKADTVKNQKADTPHKENNYLYLLSQFEQFWNLYPEKKSRRKAQAVFEELNPDQSLCNQIFQALTNQINHRKALTVQGTWVPPWKYPDNWLAQGCWEDELLEEVTKEKQHANHEPNHRKNNTPADMFCPPDDEESGVATNVIQFQRGI